MVIHHIEQLMGVPYRYTKEFNHPVLRNGIIQYEPFYLFVRYLDSEVEIDLDIKFSHTLFRGLQNKRSKFRPR